MKDQELLDHLERLAEGFSIKVIVDQLWGKGGTCRLRGREYLIINRAIPNREKVRLFAQALAHKPMDDLYVLPQVRQAIERYGRDV
jgi:hypothetical protein